MTAAVRALGLPRGCHPVLAELPYAVDEEEFITGVIGEGFPRQDVVDVLDLCVVNGCLLALDPALDLAERSLDQLRALARIVEAFSVVLSRVNVNPFIEYAWRDEETGNTLQQADFHIEWQRLWDENAYSVTLAPVGHGKTGQIVARMTWRLGKRPERRIAVVCDTAGQAEDRLKVVAQNILENPRVARVFPGLKRSSRRSDKWNDSQITVERKNVAKEPSLKAFGSGGPINGIRPDEIYLDDVCDFDNTATAGQRLKLVKWYDTTVSTRLPMAGHGRICVIGTPWHVDDLLHMLKSRKLFASQVWSAVINPDAPQHEWETLWCDVLSRDEIIRRYDGMTPHAFARKFLCRVRDEALRRFNEAWIALSLHMGRGRKLLDVSPRQSRFGAPLPCFTGVDLGVGQKEGNDLSALVTLALLPNGQRLIVDIQAGRWTGPEILARIVRTHKAYDSIVTVENVAAQDFIRQFAAEKDVPVQGFTTNAAKKSDEQWGIESIAVEMRAGRWVIPANAAGEAEDTEIKALLQECRNYLPTEHVGDRLMAAWFAREALRDYLAAREAEKHDAGYR